MNVFLHPPAGGLDLGEGVWDVFASLQVKISRLG